MYIKVLTMAQLSVPTAIHGYRLKYAKTRQTVLILKNYYKLGGVASHRRIRSSLPWLGILRRIFASPFQGRGIKADPLRDLGVGPARRIGHQ
jgi:hypothetical protein